jgi:cobalt-precorrin 5A hydrolase/precorrin-3B C17-methyltransferase
MSNPTAKPPVAPVILILSPSALETARRIKAATGGVIHGAAKRCAAGADVLFDDAGVHLLGLFGAGKPIVALMASGAVIRLLAPALSNKQAEPPVMSVAEDGSAVVPLIGGHHGGNDLARRIAAELGVAAAVTTAGDVRFGVALDSPPEGWTLDNPEDAKAVMAALVAGARARVGGPAGWLSGVPHADDGAVSLTISDIERAPEAGELLFRPRHLALGIGCARGAAAGEVLGLTRRMLADAGLAESAVGCVVSLDLKADEPALHAAAAHFNAPFRVFDAATLEAETPRLANPSDVVFAEVGTHGVAEAAALAACGPQGELIVEKQKTANATAAIARAPEPFTAASLPGRAQGALFVVGIGPGSDAWRSPEVTALVGRASDLVGYSLYLDLLGPLAAGKARHDFPLGREEDRVRHAMELAGQGRDVALVCSGDAGIYAMATLVFELLDKGGLSAPATRIEVIVSPGISALQAAAARAGAPLGHDFCTISLSDLLTPWEHIRKRVRAAAEADFVIAFYNPVSMKRRTQLAFARDELLKHRPADTPVILATNLGRDGESVRIVPLAELNIDDVDMLTVVIVGSSETRTVTTGDGRTWAYTPRGYSGKAGTGMG